MPLASALPSNQPQDDSQYVPQVRQWLDATRQLQEYRLHLPVSANGSQVDAYVMQQAPIIDNIRKAIEADIGPVRFRALVLKIQGGH